MTLPERGELAAVFLLPLVAVIARHIAEPVVERPRRRLDRRLAQRVQIHRPSCRGLWAAGAVRRPVYANGTRLARPAASCQFFADAM